MENEPSRSPIAGLIPTLPFNWEDLDQIKREMNVPEWNDIRQKMDIAKIEEKEPYLKRLAQMHDQLEREKTVMVSFSAPLLKEMIEHIEMIHVILAQKEETIRQRDETIKQRDEIIRQRDEIITKDKIIEEQHEEIIKLLKAKLQEQSRSQNRGLSVLSNENALSTFV